MFLGGFEIRMEFVCSSDAPAAFEDVAEVDEHSEGEQLVALQRLLKNGQQGGKQLYGIFLEVEQELVGLVAGGGRRVRVVEMCETFKDCIFVDVGELIGLHFCKRNEYRGSSQHKYLEIILAAILPHSQITRIIPITTARLRLKLV